jgi:hypothetical protein
MHCLIMLVYMCPIKIHIPSLGNTTWLGVWASMNSKHFDFVAVYPVKSLDAPYGRLPPYGRWGYNNQKFDPFHHGGHMMALDYIWFYNYIVYVYMYIYIRISYHIISHNFTSYHIISFHIISFHIISFHIISFHIISVHRI